MKRLALVLIFPALAAPVTAHGGAYRGPSHCFSGPPNSGGSASSRDAAPAATPAPGPGPGAAPPSTGAPPGPTPPAAPSTPGLGARASFRAGSVPRGIQIGEDFSKWQYWWEFNKDSYLLLRDSLHGNSLVAGSDEEFMGAVRGRVGRLSLPPSQVDIDGKVVPALLQALRRGANRDIASSCLVALAKIGRDGGEVKLQSVFEEYLESRDQEIRETAALAMGISQRVSAVNTLMALVLDDQVGRRLTDRSRVDVRTRAFAAYGLGLIAHAHASFPVRSDILRALRSVLNDTALADRNIKVAALNALGLFRVDDKTGAKVRRVSENAVEVLLSFYDEQRGPGHDLLRAHVPPAVARLLGKRESKLAELVKRKFAGEIRAGSRSSESLQRSACLALGQLAFSGEERKSDAWISKAIQKQFSSGSDGQARYFSLVALAQIGGESNRRFLLRVLQKGSRALERPWAALALGCAEFTSRKQGARDLEVGKALHAALGEARSPYARGAVAISLGLAGHTEAGPDLVKQLASHGHQDEMSGYVCVGLAMMGYKKAVQPIADVLDHSVRRPHRMRMASIALGKLGDRRLTGRLLGMLKDREPNLAKMSAVASALAQIGDRESIDPLREMLLDEKLPFLTRAFAAVALGGITDKEPMPWNAKIAVNMNYRAAVETLVMSGAGVLEIL